MRILHLSSHDLIGGRFTGYGMQQVLDGTEHQVEMAVWEKTADHPHVYGMQPPPRVGLGLLTKLIHRFGDGLGLDGLTGVASFALPYRGYFQQADVVHLHLLHNGPYFSLLPLPHLDRLKPLVWTLHDTWALTGMCVHPFECERWLTGCAGRCPHPRGNSPLRHYAPALHWQLKRRIYRRLNATLVVASSWMQERVRRSPLLSHLPLHLIPFGVDLDAFAPRNRADARARFGLAPGERVLAFRGVPDTLPAYAYKGMRWLREALELYEPPQPTTLIIVQDASAFEHLAPKYKLVRLGWAEGELLVDALNAADLFLMPSLQESFGLMAVEAMACGTPVLVCEGTALPEVIKAPEGGLVVPARDSTALAAAIHRFLDDDDLLARTGRSARHLAEREYSLPLYVKRHLRVYEAAIERHHRRKVSGDGL